MRPSPPPQPSGVAETVGATENEAAAPTEPLPSVGPPVLETNLDQASYYFNAYEI